MKVTTSNLPSTDECSKMLKAYFSHPSLTYHTNTEELAIRIVKKRLGIDKIINPYDFKGRKKEKLGEMLLESDIVIGMSLYEKYPYIVWNDMEYGISSEKEVYTLNVPIERSDPMELGKGFFDEYVKLSLEETDKLYSNILKEERKGIMSRLFLGKLGKKSVF